MNEHYLEVAIKAAKTSGDILVNYFEKVHDCRQKNQNIRDLVTEVDMLSENNIKKVISESFPNHSIIAEESHSELRDKKKIWYIDPVDGTVNYSQGIPWCVVSIALQENAELIVGVIFNPFTEELFFASKGNGAFLNGKQIHVSQKEDYEGGVYIAAFSSTPSEEKRKEYEIFGHVNDTTRGTMRIGSAALALAFLANGRIDGFWSKDLHAWDLAAGVILVREAGGEISSGKDGEYAFEQPVLIASNGKIHEKLSAVLSEL